MKSPTMKSVWKGQKGNKFKVYEVKVFDSYDNSEKYYHMTQQEAIRQFNAAKKVYLNFKYRQKFSRG